MSAVQAQDAQAARLLLPATNPNIQNQTGQAALSLVIESLAFWGDHGGDFTALLKREALSEAIQPRTFDTDAPTSAPRSAPSNRI